MSYFLSRLSKDKNWYYPLSFLILLIPNLLGMLFNLVFVLFMLTAILHIEDFFVACTFLALVSFIYFASC